MTDKKEFRKKVTAGAAAIIWKREYEPGWEPNM
jgi:hypothetical protein